LPPGAPDWAAPEDFDRTLGVLGRALREHCDPLLRMDLKLLEEVCSHP
jgi:hypothetical protein